MGDTRVVRTRTFEVKFLVAADTARRIREWARRQLDPDPHGGGAFGDEYRTASVYFDTDALDVFHRRGSYGRSRYRVRRYGDAGVVFLERKLREPGVLVKRRTVAPMAALPRLNGDAWAGPWPGEWFARRVRVRGMRPVCRIAYHRTARCRTADGSIMRLTLDEGVVAAAVSDVAFASCAEAHVLDGHAILELKFGGHLPAVFKHLIEEHALDPGRISKYRCGMAALSKGRLTSAHA